MGHSFFNISMGECARLTDISLSLSTGYEAFEDPQLQGMLETMSTTVERMTLLLQDEPSEVLDWKAVGRVLATWPRLEEVIVHVPTTAEERQRAIHYLKSELPGT